MVQSIPTRILLVAALALTVSACGKSKGKSDAEASAAANALTLSTPSLAVPPGGTATITATGGTGIYTSAHTTAGAIYQTSPGVYTFTAPSTVPSALAVEITVTDSANNTGRLGLTISAATGGGGMVMYATSATVAPGGTVTLSVEGGSPPYSWLPASGGGTLSATTGQSVVYTAPGAPGVATIMVQDSMGATVTGTLTISGTGTGAGKTCDGYYAINAGGNPGTLFLAPPANGQTVGYLRYSSGQMLNLTANCNATGIVFTLSDSTVFTGQWVYTQFDPLVASMVGKFGPSQQTWVAVPLY